MIGHTPGLWGTMVVLGDVCYDGGTVPAFGQTIPD